MPTMDILKWDAEFHIPSLTIQYATTNVYTVAPTTTFEDVITQLDIIFRSHPSATSWAIPYTSKNIIPILQRPLTEEIDPKLCKSLTPTRAEYLTGGIVTRPVDVCNSIVFRHSSLCGNKYKAGKLFHLLAPKFIDRNGAYAYGSWHLGLGTIICTPPTGFLTNAVYPVTLDPTFGKTAIGLSEYTNNGTRMRVSKYTLPAAGTVTQINAYIKLASNGNSKGAMYDQVLATGATNLVASSSAVAVTTTFSWVAFTVSYIATAADYHLGFASDDTWYVKYDSGATFTEQIVTYPALPNPYNGGTGDGDMAMSIYANYTAAGGVPRFVLFKLLSRGGDRAQGASGLRRLKLKKA